MLCVFNFDEQLRISKISSFTSLTRLRSLIMCPEVEFKEFEPRLKVEMQLKFHLKFHSMFQYLNRHSNETSFDRFERIYLKTSYNCEG